MNKTAVKNFAIWARKELIEKVTQKAKIFGIEKDQEMRPMDTALNGKILTAEEKKARNILIEKINIDGFGATIDEVAYTWFNRFIAIRFMEVNGYMPSHIRVFSSENNEFEPQILTEAINIELPGLDKEKVLALYNDGNKEEELFNYIFITQCNALNEVLPGMFQELNDYTELLLPDGLLRENSVLDKMVKEIPENDWKEQVQIIGWLYQYYNEERKDEVINVFSGNIAKNDIPAATQLFTTDWVVRYIVDNSLGRYWIERNPESNLKEKLEFLVLPKSGEIEYIDEQIDPKELKILDNSVGSGHFLIYEFEVLMEIYKEYGYREREAVEYILNNNLYGLDIDERAKQLAYFSVMMKARSYNRRILNRGITPNIYTISESNHIETSYLDIFGNNLTLEERKVAQESIEQLLRTFKDGKNYGSILIVEVVDFELCRKYVNDLDLGQQNLFVIEPDEIQRELINILDVAEVMTMKYDIVATNPPYLNRMNADLKKYVNQHYKDYKTDLFSVFMYRNFEMCKVNGYSGFMTPLVWMFIKSYEKLRKFITQNKSIGTLIQMEYSAFEEATVPICAFVLKNGREDNDGLYFRLSEFTGGMKVQKEKVLEALENPNCGYFYETSIDNFNKIPGKPISYWASEKVYGLFSSSKKIGDLYKSAGRNKTHNNNKFVRKHWEINIQSLLNDWKPYENGGKFRKYYGNKHDVVNWTSEALDFYKVKGGLINLLNIRLEGITWNLITSSDSSFRIKNENDILSSASPTIISKDNSVDNNLYILALLNSKITVKLLKMYNPTLNTTVNDVLNLPLILSEVHDKEVKDLVEENIKLSKIDWDTNESSWDFKRNPLLNKNIRGNVRLLAEVYENFKHYANTNFDKLKKNEEKLNEIFIEIYELEKEIGIEIPDKDITIAKIFDTKEEIYDEIKGNPYILTRENVVKNFLSYFIGCVMGRYSLDEDGLVLAGGEFDPSKYQTFQADEDGIISLTDQEYFEDDIVELFIKFLKVTFGEEHLNENLDFIASELKGTKSDSSRDKIRKYFLNDFYKDHCKMYQKLPIYWQYDSGKNGASKGLFYLHRYDKNTFANIRINYVFEIQDRYKQELARLEDQIVNASGSEKVQLQKRVDLLKKKIIESQQFEEKVQHIADSYIEIDLDDGVKENYQIFKDVLAKIK